MGEVIELKTRKKILEDCELKKEYPYRSDIDLLSVYDADNILIYTVKFNKQLIGYIKQYNYIKYFYPVSPDIHIRGDLLEIILEVVRDLNEVR